MPDLPTMPTLPTMRNYEKTRMTVNMAIILFYRTSVEFVFTVENFLCPWHGTSMHLGSTYLKLR